MGDKRKKKGKRGGKERVKRENMKKGKNVKRVKLRKTSGKTGERRDTVLKKKTEKIEIKFLYWEKKIDNRVEYIPWILYYWLEDPLLFPLTGSVSGQLYCEF